MGELYPIQNTENDHTKDLKEAIYYLPHEIDKAILFKALKAIYGNEEGKKIAIDWFYEAKIGLPASFDKDWEEADLTPYQRHDIEAYLNKHIYDLARQVGWIPKAFRRGKNTKKPPSKKKLKLIGQELSAGKELEDRLTEIKEQEVPESNRSFLPPHITNLDGACYFHPYMKKTSIPDDRAEYLDELTKIVDCEVIVEEAIEYLIEQPGQVKDDKEVRYRLRLTNRKDKDVESIATFEELTTVARFSSFLVSKGFVKFLGSKKDFDAFHTFLINEQDYPTVKHLSSWGEYKPGEFLFENGLYDTKTKQFYSADEQNRIQKGSHYLLCPSGSELIRPPRINMPGDVDESARFLADKFTLWESFNGRLNVRATLGYAVACLFSRQIKESDGAFPLLFKFGERGTGKSSSMDWFMALFGYRSGNRQSVSKQNTIKGLNRNMTLPTSFPFFLDDYRNHESNSQVPNLTSPILNWYHRIGTSMAKKSTDNQTIDTRMKASVVMTGNDKPTDPAVRSRLLILNYSGFLQKKQLEQVKEITDYTYRFSEFTALVLRSYYTIQKRYMEYLESSKKMLADQGFQGRTVNNWAYVFTGIRCMPHILPDLHHWKEDFEALRSEIYEAIQKEEAQQKQYNPLHEFFGSIEFYATQKMDAASDFNQKFNVLDHRHFRIKSYKEFDQYKGEVLYLHLPSVWQTLVDIKAEITKQTSLEALTHKIEQSTYYLSSSEQIFLTRSIDQIQKESNRRCVVLNVKQLKEKEMMGELIERAEEYELQRPSRLNP